MTLEPSDRDERGLQEVLKSLCCHPSSGTCTCNYALAAKEAFAYVRDIVLEAAAKRLDESSAGCTLDEERGEAMAHAAAVVRAMKGKQG